MTTKPPPPLSVPALFERYSGAFATREVSDIVALHADDGTFWLHTGQEPVQGREAIGATFAQFFRDWPNLSFDVRRILYGPDFWVLDWALRADLGDGVAFPLTDVVTVDSDGLIAQKETWVDLVQVQAELARVAASA